MVKKVDELARRSNYVGALVISIFAIIMALVEIGYNRYNLDSMVDRVAALEEEIKGLQEAAEHTQITIKGPPAGRLYAGDGEFLTFYEYIQCLPVDKAVLLMAEKLGFEFEYTPETKVPGNFHIKESEDATPPVVHPSGNPSFNLDNQANDPTLLLHIN